MKNLKLDFLELKTMFQYESLRYSDEHFSFFDDLLIPIILINRHGLGLDYFFMLKIPYSY